MKNFVTVSVLMLSLMVLFAAHTVYANDAIRVTVNGQPVAFADQGPVIVDGRTLVPVRGVFEALGFEISWDDETETAALISENYKVEIIVGQSWFTVNGIGSIGMSLDVPAQIIGGRTMLPIRAVLESVNYYVDWDETTQTVEIISAPVGVRHEFPEAGFSFDIPTSWSGKFRTHEWETAVEGGVNHFVEVYHLATRLENEYTGRLWTFARFVGEDYDEEHLPIMAGGTLILAQTGGYTYFVNGPSGVQYSEVPGSASAAEYKRMDARLATIINSFRLME